MVVGIIEVHAAAVHQLVRSNSYSLQYGGRGGYGYGYGYGGMRAREPDRVGLGWIQDGGAHVQICYHQQSSAAAAGAAE